MISSHEIEYITSITFLSGSDTSISLPHFTAWLVAFLSMTNGAIPQTHP